MIKRDGNNLWILFGVASVALAGMMTVKFASPPSADRAPSSAPAAAKLSKAEVLRGHKTKRLPVSGKGNGLLEIAIQAPGKGAVGKGTTINLDAAIEARSDLKDLKYVWILPKDGVRVVSGSVSGDLGSLPTGQFANLQLSVISDTDENRRVHLHVYHVVNGENMGNMAQYNTVDQEAIEWVAKDKAEKLREAAKASNTVNKIYQ